ncbi:MAG: DUF4389 domain-containing protein [Actinobacteria bacterium]|nr:DUF4389 domain-containing protein [Actinomycetota bacterium]
MSYPIALELDYVAKRSRLSTFFRFILVFPLLFVGYVYAIGLFFVLIIAWFALLFTARWPVGLYEFVGGVLRFATRLNAYAMLAVDKYPPFGLKPDAGYPARVRLAPPAAKYSRLAIFFRFLYVLPAYVIAYILSIFAGLIAFVSWFVIVITGRQPAGLQNALFLCLNYITRATGLIYMLTDAYPPLSD